VPYGAGDTAVSPWKFFEQILDNLDQNLGKFDNFGRNLDKFEQK